MALSMFLVIGALCVVVSPAVAQAAACHGEAATVVGPTQGQDTTGTEGNDVIIAPLSMDSVVSGLGGDDTICLVNGDPGRAESVHPVVRAGEGDDTVLNESTRDPAFWSLVTVELGTGSDHFVGAAYGEAVFGADATDVGNGNDTEVDTIDTRGGDDAVSSGTDAVDSPNGDVIATGAGRDTIGYAGMSGGTIDNGTGADKLVLRSGWTGRLDIDNVAEHATLGAETLLTWTAVDGFYLHAAPGRLVAFAGSDVAEDVEVTGSVVALEAPGAQLVTSGGRDIVRLDDYLPSAVDLGQGHDALEYDACHRVVINLPSIATCTTGEADEVVTSLSGIDVLRAFARESLHVVGSDGNDAVEAYASSKGQVRVDSLGGDDRVEAGGGGPTLVRGGRGSDRLFGWTVFGGRGDDVLSGGGGAQDLFGGRGDDLLRGGQGRDRLLGGLGRDIAKGEQGVDRCVAEVRIDCELR